MGKKSETVKLKTKLIAIQPIEEVPITETEKLVTALGKIKLGASGLPLNLTDVELQNLAKEDPELHRLVTGENSIEDLLKKGEEETEQMFKIRSDITKKISVLKLQGDKPIDLRSCIVLGAIITQKAVNGVSYSDKIESIIQLIISKM